MSKEQTPIEELIDYFLSAKKNRIEKFEVIEIIKLLQQARKKTEEHTQAKVLEFAEWEQSNTAHLNYPPKELVDMFTKQK